MLRRTKAGFDLNMHAALRGACPWPVIAIGGAGAGNISPLPSVAD